MHFGLFNLLQQRYRDRMDVPLDRRFIGLDAYQQAMDCLRPGDVAIFATPPAFRWVHFAYAIQKGAFVVTTTRTGSGSIGGGRGGTSRRLGGDDLQPLKARVLLMLALATTTDPAEVRRMFGEY